jgi:hypothetical protein
MFEHVKRGLLPAVVAPPVVTAASSDNGSPTEIVITPPDADTDPHPNGDADAGRARTGRTLRHRRLGEARVDPYARPAVTANE